MPKSKDTIADLRGKDTRELVFDLGERRKELFHTRFQPDAESTNTSAVRNLRRTIARILTILKERARAAGEQQAS